MIMNYNELYEILKKTSKKKEIFKIIEDLNVTMKPFIFILKSRFTEMVLFLPLF